MVTGRSLRVCFSFVKIATTLLRTVDESTFNRLTGYVNVIFLNISHHIHCYNNLTTSCISPTIETENISTDQRKRILPNVFTENFNTDL